MDLLRILIRITERSNRIRCSRVSSKEPRKLQSRVRRGCTLISKDTLRYSAVEVGRKVGAQHTTGCTISQDRNNRRRTPVATMPRSHASVLALIRLGKIGMTSRPGGEWNTRWIGTDLIGTVYCLTCATNCILIRGGIDRSLQE